MQFAMPRAVGVCGFPGNLVLHFDILPPRLGRFFFAPVQKPMPLNNARMKQETITLPWTCPALLNKDIRPAT